MRDCGSTKPDRSAERLRRYRRLAALHQAYLDGSYIVGSHHRETVCEGCHRTFPLWRDGPMRYCSRKCAGLDIGHEVAKVRKRLETDRRGYAVSVVLPSLRSMETSGACFARQGVCVSTPAAPSERTIGRERADTVLLTNQSTSSRYLSVIAGLARCVKPRRQGD
jgi:hypothetical protein